MLAKRFLIIIGAILFAFLTLTLVLDSSRAQADPTAPASPAVLEVIAGNLANPRGLAFGPDGALYITEAGSGGDGACIPGPDGQQCYGTSGAVSMVTFDSNRDPVSQERVVTGLSSLGEENTGGNATGANDIAFTNTGDMYILMGLGADPAVRAPAGPLGAAGINFGQLVFVDDEGNWSNEVDVAAHEAAYNPDGAQVDSNPYALLATSSGFKVIDAGGNDLLNVALVTENKTEAAAIDITTLAIFPARPVEFPPGSGQMIPMDAVPTAVEMGPDGAYYVSQLTGFPFPLGGANIYRVVANEDPEIYLSGFTNVLDLVWGPDGSLFVLEMAKDSLLADPPPVGQIIQVTPYGSRSVIASEGLVAPVDMEIGPDHALYVINNGPSATLGQVVRIPLPSSTTIIPASKDNTLFESDTGAISNGAGQHLFAGVTDTRTGHLKRRGVLAFDAQAALPAGATVISATLELNMSRTASGDKDVSLHLLEQAWGEGASDADGAEGGGATAESGDATWLFTFFDSGTWDTAGGDYNAPASATSTAVGAIGRYSWSSAQMASDVQAWLNGSSANHGWLLLGDESGEASAKRFDSRENPEPDNRPKLSVRYIAPLPESAVFLPAVSAD